MLKDKRLPSLKDKINKVVVEKKKEPVKRTKKK